MVLVLLTYETVTGNWTRPNNIWHSNNPLNPIITFNVKPSICPPHADHLPIVTLLDLTITQVIDFPSHNKHHANFTSINEKLCLRSELYNLATWISHREDIDKAANSLADIIKEVVEEVVPVLKPTPLCQVMVDERTHRAKERK